MMSVCIEQDYNFSKRGEVVIASWHLRNDKYLILRPTLLSEIRTQAISDGQEAWWNEFESVTMPKRIELVVSSLLNHLKTLPEGDQRNAMCEAYAISIDKGTLDIANEDAKIVAFLNQRLEQLPNSDNKNMQGEFNHKVQ